MIKKFTSIGRQPRSHDSTPGVNQLYPPGTYRDYYKIETDYPSNHPEYTVQTNQFDNSVFTNLPRGISNEQIFQLLKRKYNLTRDQFENMMKKNKYANVLDQMLDKIKGSEAVEDILKDQTKDEKVKIEVKSLGNGALAETLPNGTIIINDDIDDVDDFDASRLVHELSHFVDWQEENYLDRPQERDAFINQIAFLLEKGYTKQQIQEKLLPIFDDYKSPIEAEKTLNQMIEDAKKQLTGSIKIAKTFQANISFTPEEKIILDKISTAADKLGIKVFLAGGLIRDRLLGIPSSDLDFVCNKNSEQLAEYLVKQYGLNPAVKMDRSGATMIFIDGKYIDLIDAKKVFSLIGQDLPLLEQGEEGEGAIMFDDSVRRDLTINSLMYGLQSGKLYDPSGKGLSDINNKVIRTIIPPEHKYRFSPMDMLRALRFYATKDGFKFAPGMLEAMKANVDKLAPRQQHGDISSRRIERELRKTKTDQQWSKMKAALAEIGANKYIGDEIRSVDEDKKGEIEYNFEKQSSDFAGRPVPNTNALPQEQTFTYPYPDGERNQKNYNGFQTLKNKELDRKKQKIKQLLERTK